MKVLIAPDSFKGTLTAREAAEAVADGWRSVRPQDSTLTLPMADGGEGTLDALLAAAPGGRLVVVPRVTGPTGRPVDAAYLQLPDGTAVVELARSSGLPLARPPDALHATTRGVGEVVRAALDHGSVRLVLALGGSASTDGGAGLLSALGLRVLDDRGEQVPDGGAGLLQAVRVDATALVPPPPAGVLVLNDVDAPLLGDRGAAAVYGPQKGAGPDQQRLLEMALARWAELSGGHPDAPGAGAAGGTAFGLQAWFGADLVGGSEHVARLVGLDDHLRQADLLVTGEGRFDATSLRGKVCGFVLSRARRAGVPAVVVCGHAEQRAARGLGAAVVSLSDLAGSSAVAQERARCWAARAGAAAASRATSLDAV